MSEQSKAIQMANLLNNEVIPDNLFADIEAELRRLDAENAALKDEVAHKNRLIGMIDALCLDAGILPLDTLAMVRSLIAERDALRGESENKSKLIKLCLQTADAELIKQKGQINYLVRERDALRAQLAQGEPVNVAEIKQGMRKNFSSWLWAVAECYEDTEHRKVLIDIATGFQTLIQVWGIQNPPHSKRQQCQKAISLCRHSPLIGRWRLV